MGLVNAAGSNDISSMDILAAGKGNIQKESLSETFSQLVQDKKEEYFTKVKNGGFEPSYQIGASSYTETEWKKLLLYFDAAEEKMRQAVEKTKNKVQEENKIKDSDEDDEFSQNGMDMLLARFTTVTYPSDEKDVPDDVYYTFYSPDGIYCRRQGQSDFEWHIKFSDESQYDKVMSFLDGLKNTENQSFTIHNIFWQDFLSGELGADDFKEFLDARERGEVSNGLIVTENGMYFDREVVKYSRYMYGREYGAYIMRTSEELFAWQEKKYIHERKYTVEETDRLFLQNANRVNKGNSKGNLNKHIQNPDKVLGIGFLNSPDSKISYGMRAEYSENSTSDSPIIKVTVQTGGPEKVHYIDINHVDARNATEIEMFALCCYADDTGKGTGGKFGTWQTLNYYRTNASDIGEFELTNSTDNYLSLRQNWLLMIEQMRKLYINAGLYKQSADGDSLLKFLA